MSLSKDKGDRKIRKLNRRSSLGAAAPAAAGEASDLGSQLADKQKEGPNITNACSGWPRKWRT